MLLGQCRLSRTADGMTIGRPWCVHVCWDGGLSGLDRSCAVSATQQPFYSNGLAGPSYHPAVIVAGASSLLQQLLVRSMAGCGQSCEGLDTSLSMYMHTSQHSARRFAGLATCQMAVCTSFSCSCRLQLLRCAYVDSCMLGCIKVSGCAQVQRCPLGIDKRALWWCYHHAGTCAGGMLACVALIWWQRT